MAFLQNITGMLVYGTYTVSLSLFLLSAALLIAGITIQAWSDTTHLRFLDRKAISWIEKTHPHLPSVRSLFTFNLCALALLAVGLQTMRGVFPFNDPYQGLNIVTLFLLAAAIGTLGELRWRGTKQYASAFILGTAFAFLALSILSTDSLISLPERMALALCTVGAALLAWYTLSKQERNIRMAAAVGSVFLFWLFTYTLQ